jgi:hypothetical protein
MLVFDNISVEKKDTLVYPAVNRPSALGRTPAFIGKRQARFTGR